MGPVLVALIVFAAGIGVLLPHRKAYFRYRLPSPRLRKYLQSVLPDKISLKPKVIAGIRRTNFSQAMPDGLLTLKEVYEDDNKQIEQRCQAMPPDAQDVQRTTTVRQSFLYWSLAAVQGAAAYALKDVLRQGSVRGVAALFSASDNSNSAKVLNDEEILKSGRVFWEEVGQSGSARCGRKLDITKTRKAAVSGAIAGGVCMQAWYVLLDLVVLQKSFHSVIYKVVADTFVRAPVVAAANLAWGPFIYQGPGVLIESLGRQRERFWAEWLRFLRSGVLYNFLAFMLIPTGLRPFVTGLVGILWE